MTFAARLRKLIQTQAQGHAPSVYRAAGLDRRSFAKLFHPNHHPSRMTVLALVFALKLPPYKAFSLLRAAGYALGDATAFDCICRQCLVQRITSLSEVNDVLFAHGCPIFPLHDSL